MRSPHHGSDQYLAISQKYALETTVMADKSNLYEGDIFFRESAFLLHQMFGDRTLDVLDRYSYILLKPDGVVARAMDSLTSCLNDNGFTVRGVKRVSFNRHSIRELWKYELNRATLQRLQAIDILLTANHSVLLFIENIHPAEQSCSSRLKSIKGPVVKGDRSETDVRHVIDAGHGLLNYIHTPDETADFIRELAVLLPPADITMLFEGRSAPWCVTESKSNEVYAGSTENPIDVSKSVNCLLNNCTSLDNDLEQELAEDLNSLLSDNQFDWQYIWDAYCQGTLNAEKWDVIVVIAAATQCNLDGVEALLKFPPHEAAEGHQ